MDALVQQSFMEIQIMNLVCCSRNLKDDGDFVNEKLLSLFSLIKKQYHSFLTSEQMNEDPNHDIGQIQLKPRDLRRILFNDNMQKNPNSLHQLTSNITDTKVHASSTSKLCGDAVEQDKEREVEEQNKLFASHKLCLVLDLDLTLLNSFEDLDSIYNEKRKKIEEKEQEKPQQQQQQLFWLEHMRLWTKLRPVVRNFLEKVNNFSRFELMSLFQ
ncbi:putative protein-serine/threonine phosphatase [Dioscorea sansibarensis]